jgi:bifunctional ADP-heptose synthase (sugar kinase/adenylyltransferase)
MHNMTGGQHLDAKTKVQKATARFQQQRRAKRREKLLRLFVELHEEFEALVPQITADISNLLSLADIICCVDRAAGIIKRYKQLANEAKHLGLEPPPVPQLPDGITEAYVLIVGRRPRPASKAISLQGKHRI